MNENVLLTHQTMDAIACKILNGSIANSKNIVHINITEPQSFVYYRSTKRGGGAVIISPDGGWLLKNPLIIGYKEHLQMFLDGERSNI